MVTFGKSEYFKQMVIVKLCLARKVSYVLV